MAREFDELALDGYNYPIWALDVKISLTFHGIIAALTPPAEREAAFLDTYKYHALYIIQNHLHPNLKSEYVMEEEAHSLWVALKGRFELQKMILLPEPNHEWTQIHLQDFKSIEDYNYAIHKVYAKLRFCEKEPSEEDKIEKILQTMLPSNRVLQHQYQTRNYQHYADLIHDLLQAEKHDELTIKNHHQCRVGAAPLPEIHHNEKNASASKDSTPKKDGRYARHRRNRQKNIKLSMYMKKDDASSKKNNVQCKAHRTFKHTTAKCCTLKHLMPLYQKSLKRTRKFKVWELDMKLTSPSRRTRHLKLIVRARIPRIQAPTSRR
jgi:hypothetical protein